MLVIAGAEDRITTAPVVRQVAIEWGRVQKFENHARWVLGESGWQDSAQHLGSWPTTIAEAP